jgi:hypothetical protein
MLTAIAGIAGVSKPFALDKITLSNSGGFFSLTRLKSSYANSVCKIRANTTLAEGNVNLNGDVVNLGSEVIVTVKGTSVFNVFDRVSLSTFLGSQSAVCLAIYDQSGNGRFLDTKSAAANYPIFATAGVLENINGISCLKGTGSQHLYGNVGTRSINVCSGIAVVKKLQDGGDLRYLSFTQSLGSDWGSAGSFSMNTGSGSGTMSIQRMSPNTKAVAINEAAIISFVFDGTNLYLRKNNDTAVTAASTGTFTFDIMGLLGMNSGGSNFANGFIADSLLFNYAIGDTDRVAIEKELGKKYSITVA